MKILTLALIALVATACTQPATPPAEAPVADGKAAAATSPPAGSVASENPQPTTPILSVLVGSSVAAAVKGTWCLKDGTAPFTKISAQDESIAAPIESQSAPMPGTTTAKDTTTQQAPGTARITTQISDSQFHLQWLSAGIKGEADLSLQGDALSFSDENGRATFSRCP